MFGFAKKPVVAGPQVNMSLCTDKYNGKYPMVGLYDCPARKVWVCKPLDGQAIRTSHARLITGCDNAVGTVWKDRFLCFWFYTPNTGQGQLLGRQVDWKEANLVVRIDPQWDYDRQRLIAAEQIEQQQENVERQMRHGRAILDFFAACKLKYPLTMHLLTQRAEDSYFAYAKL